MSGKLATKRVAILATDGVEQVELTEPRRALEEAGARCEIVSPKGGKIKSWMKDHWGEPLPVDQPLSRARVDDYDALLLPGGVMNPDHLRQDQNAVEFVRAFMDAGKPVAAICHGPWLLAEAGVVDGRTVTSWPSLKTDLRNAGANWVDQDVVADHGLVTSRRPADLPSFNAKMIEEFAEGIHDPAMAGTGAGSEASSRHAGAYRQIDWDGLERRGLMHDRRLTMRRTQVTM